MLPHGLVAELGLEQVDACGFARSRCMIVAMTVLVNRSRLGHYGMQQVYTAEGRRSGTCGYIDVVSPDGDLRLARVIRCCQRLPCDPRLEKRRCQGRESSWRTKARHGSYIRPRIQAMTGYYNGRAQAHARESVLTSAAPRVSLRCSVPRTLALARCL